MGSRDLLVEALDLLLQAPDTLFRVFLDGLSEPLHEPARIQGRDSRQTHSMGKIARCQGHDPRQTHSNCVNSWT